MRKSKIGITDAKIWFKLLRNFGEFIEFLHIFAKLNTNYDKFTTTTKIPNALKNLNKYVNEYCTDSLEVLELQQYSYFTLNNPLPWLQEFNVDCGVHCEHWNTDALKFIPNLRSLNILCVPFIRFFCTIESTNNISEFKNRHGEHNNLIFSSIEINLTQ